MAICDFLLLPIRGNEKLKNRKFLLFNNLQAHEKSCFFAVFSFCKIDFSSVKSERRIAVWKIISRPRKIWNKVPEAALAHQKKKPPVGIRDPPVRHARPIRPGEPLAHCAGCRDWTPMRWLPVAERGKKAGQWFECEFCGGRELTLRYMPTKQEKVSCPAMHNNNLKGVGA